jgi:hypothetical protein
VGATLVAAIYVTLADGTLSTTSTMDACTTITLPPLWVTCTLNDAPVDINGDGLTNLVWVTADSIPKQLGLMQGKGDGTFIALPGIADSSLQDFAPYFIDANSDGNVDIVWDKIDSSGRSAGERRLWLGKGDGTFISQSNLAGRDGALVGFMPNFGDFNGDGLVDILWVQTNTKGYSSGARELWLNKGDATFTVISGQADPPIDSVPTIADFNGDGKTDILWDNRPFSWGGSIDTRSDGTRVLWLSDGITPDLVTTVTTGIGATAAVTYKLLTDSAVYTKDNTATDPIVDLQGAMNVVSRVDASNGVGGNLSSTYAYAGAKVHLDGRGFLGFREMKVTDLQTNIVRTSTYRQDFPFIGLAAAETTKLGAATLNSTTHTYGATALGGTRQQVFLTQSVASSADLDGSTMPAVTSTYKYDAFGNATEIVVSASDGHSKTTTNTYTNDTAKWLLGRLTRASVKSTRP